MNTLKFFLKFLLLVSLFFSYSVIAAKWTWRNPLPQGNLLNSINCPTENFCVAVGSYGTVLTSTDGGINWTVQSSGTINDLANISCSSENFCVAVGVSGTMLTSTDGGINWILQSSGTSNLIYDISCPSKNLCVAVGEAGMVLTSIDGGINWILQPSHSHPTFSDISCPTENLCFAVGFTDVLTSTDGGANWTVQFSVMDERELSHYLMTHDYTITELIFLSSISCPTKNFCAALRGDEVWISHDGGINWKHESASSFSSISCPSENLCVAIEASEIWIRSSTGGIMFWTLQLGGTYIDNLSDISCPTETLCIAVGDDIVLISTDGGINWTEQSRRYGLNSTTDISCPSETLCVAVEAGVFPQVLTSTDRGISWTGQSTRDNLSDISCPIENLCVVVGDNGAVLTSTDRGINWTQQSSSTNNRIYGISCPSKNLCVAVGEAGMVLTSIDEGSHWTLQSSNTTSRLDDINCPTENICVAVGRNGMVLISTDSGINWTVQSVGTNNSLNGISCLKNRCITVGRRGSILSADNINSTNNTPPLVKTDIESINGKIGDTFSLNLADYFEDLEDGNNLTYTVLGNYTVVEFEQSQLPQLNLILVAEGSENITLRVTDSQGLSIEYAFKVSVVSSSVCELASYSNQTQQAYLPALEVPFFTTIGSKTINIIGLYSATLEISFGFPDFEVKELTFIQTITDSNSCHTVFMPDTGILTIPILEVNAESNEAPELTCSATLQQSVLRPDVLTLIKYACDIPL